MSFMLVLAISGLFGDGSSTASALGRARQIEHFTPQEYAAYPQNWAIVSDGRGFVYVGNRDGVLQYDGNQWKVIRTTNGTTVRSLATDESGRIYVGAQGELGYLELSTTGDPVFRSLVENIPPEHRDFGDVWTTVVSSSGVFFQTKSVIFLWDGIRMKHWDSKNGFHTFFGVRDRLFVREIDVGLLEYTGGAFILVPSGELFSTIRVSAILPFSDNTLTVVTRDDGLFHMNGRGISAVDTGTTAYLKRFGVYNGRLLSSGEYALATLGGGLVVSDASGELIEVFDKSTGMPDDVVNFVSEDREGNLWLALNSNGLVRIDYGSPIRVFGRTEGIDGTISDISHSDLGLLVSTSGRSLSEEYRGFLHKGAVRSPSLGGARGIRWGANRSR